MAGRRIELSGLQPHLDGLRWEFQDAFRIGRNPKAEIVLNDASVGGLHAEILPTAQGWVVRDLGAAGGTSVNGIRVDKKMRRASAQRPHFVRQAAATGRCAGARHTDARPGRTRSVVCPGDR